MAVSEENIRLIFGLKLKQLRDDKQMSLSDLSNVSGVSVSYLNEIEKGKKYPKSDKIIALANALGSSYDQLVSLKLSKNLAPVNELLNSDIIQELPFDTFGIDKSKLFDMIANAPAKVTAFISTLLEIARNYNMKQEHFYFASLRSFQEMYDNYFDDIEKSVSSFIKEFEIPDKPPVGESILKDTLEQKFKYHISETSFDGYPHLKGFRSVFIPGKKPSLLINEKLTNKQRAFLYAKELGFQYMKLNIRPNTSSWLKVQTFEQVLNNFYASYFAGALIINKDCLIDELDAFFKKKKWDDKHFQSIMKTFDASSEMFLHRLSSILPKHYGMHQLFFIRYDSQNLDANNTQPAKELHLSKSGNPFNKNRGEHLFRRWITRKLVDSMRKKRKSHKELFVKAGKYKLSENGNEYFCISILRPESPISNKEDSVTFGFIITEPIRKKILFLDDDKIITEDSEKEFEDEMSSKDSIMRESRIEVMEKELKELVKKNKSA